MRMSHYSENNFVLCGVQHPQRRTALGEYLVLNITAVSEM